MKNRYHTPYTAIYRLGLSALVCASKPVPIEGKPIQFDEEETM